MRGGQLFCQSYWHDLLKIIENGVSDFPTIIGYELFLFEILGS